VHWSRARCSGARTIWPSTRLIERL
jgi:hypothetical protein